jgi:hypothetical protein
MLASCSDRIAVQPITVVTDTTPDFNFKVRPLNGSYIFKSTEGHELELYIRQQVANNTNTKYYVTLDPQGLYVADIQLFFKTASTPETKIYRVGDKMEIPYKYLLDNDYKIYLRYKPFKPDLGTYRVKMTCVDSNNKIQEIEIPITVI